MIRMAEMVLPKPTSSAINNPCHGDAASEQQVGADAAGPPIDQMHASGQNHWWGTQVKSVQRNSGET